MDELDILAETPVATSRRPVTTKIFEFELDIPPHEELRSSLLEALIEDAELQALPATEDHPKAMEFAVDEPEPRDSGSLIRVRIDFAPGYVDYDRVRGIIEDDLKAELLALD